MSLLDKNVRRQHFIQCHKSAVVGKLAAAVEAYKKLIANKVDEDTRKKMFFRVRESVTSAG